MILLYRADLGKPHFTHAWRGDIIKQHSLKPYNNVSVVFVLPSHPSEILFLFWKVTFSVPHHQKQEWIDASRKKSVLKLRWYWYKNKKNGQSFLFDFSFYTHRKQGFAARWKQIEHVLYNWRLIVYHWISKSQIMCESRNFHPVAIDMSKGLPRLKHLILERPLPQPGSEYL